MTDSLLDITMGMGSMPPSGTTIVPNEERLAFFESSCELLALTDIGGCFEQLNPRWQLVLGYSSDELLGTMFLDLVHESDRDATFALLMQLTASDKPVDTSTFCLHLRLRAHNDRYYWFDWNVRLSSNGIRLAMSARDITSVKLEAFRHEVLVESAPGGLMTVGPDGKILLANRQVEQLFGYPRAQLIGSSIDRLVPHAMRERHVQLRGQFLSRASNREMAHGRALRGLRADGSEFAVEVGLSSMSTPDGTLIHCSILDISDRAQREEEMARRMTELQRYRSETELLGEMTALLQHALDDTEALDIVGSFLDRLLSKTTLSLYLLPGSADALELALQRNLNVIPWRISPTECWALRRTSKHVSVAGGAACCPHIRPFLSDDHLAVCIPLSAHGTSLGVLSVLLSNADSEKEANARMEGLASAVSDQFGMALRNLQLRTTLHDLSIKDSLTGLFNRRHLDSTLHKEHERAVRKNEPLSVLMIDIDHFKRFNDEHGHQAADIQLQTTARVLSQAAVEDEAACRYGGEEFLLILPATNLAEAIARAEEIRLEVHRATGERVTISIGVSSFPRDGTDGAGLIEVADRALYAAKERGRNRVVGSDSLRTVERGT